MALLDKHRIIEKNATLLLVGSLFVVSIGGIVEIAPLFTIHETVEKAPDMRVYTPEELCDTLREAGFASPFCRTHRNGRWLCVMARK